MVGDQGAGKSSLMRRFVDDEFTDNYSATIGVEFQIKTLLVEDETVQMQIWDPAGHERFRTIVSSYFRGTDAALLIFDLSNKSTFHHLEDWIGRLQENSVNNLVLVGSKADQLPHHVSDEEVQEFCARYDNIPYIATSSKTNHNVSEVFLRVALQLVKQPVSHIRKTASLRLSQPLKPEPTKKKGGCC
jgi:small GTP-binding protein